MADRSVRPLRHLVHAVTGGQPPSEAQVRQAAWIARCVGRGGSAPLHRDDVSALAETLQVKEFAPGAVVFHADQTADGVWIVRHGLIELAVGSRRRRAVVNILHPGDVDGDIPLLLEMPMVYTGRALTQATCLFLDRQAFERLLATHPAIARRWLSSVAQRVSTAQIRLMGMLGRPRRLRSSCSTRQSMPVSNLPNAPSPQCLERSAHRSTRFSRSSSATD